jgi:hypothetical protein
MQSRTFLICGTGGASGILGAVSRTYQVSFDIPAILQQGNWIFEGFDPAYTVPADLSVVAESINAAKSINLYGFIQNSTANAANLQQLSTGAVCCFGGFSVFSVDYTLSFNNPVASSAFVLVNIGARFRSAD